MKGDEEDIVLVRRFKDGDEKAFDRLFEKYQVPLYSICYRFSRNEADARDLTQDIFIKVYTNLKKFHEKSKFFTWLYRVAVNTCISFKRKTKPRQHDYQPHQETVSLDERVRMKIAIDDALVQLPERQRMSFVLHHYDGYTFDEIGDIMGISTGAAKANHYHAIRKLQVLLKDYV
jgi:RNA polymerase sigma-70 factor (ECF subfamily)